MSAKNGSAVKRSRLIGCCIAVVFALSAVFASGASAINPPVNQTYLALGDSLAFGYSQQLFNENEKLGEPPSAFEHGYVNYYFNHLKPKLNGVQLTNNGCPGETSDSLIGNGALAAGLGIPGESPCAYHKSGLPLHHEYGGTKSQLESALEVIALDTLVSGKPVTSITFNIGANDQLHAVAKCEAEVIKELTTEGKSKYWQPEGPFTPAAAVNGCIAAHAVELGKHIGENIGRTLFVLRQGHLFGGIDYTGKIAFLGAYDPYGNVFAYPTKAELTAGVNDEILPGSNNLVSLFNQGFKEVVEKPGFNGCFADSHPKFNPQNKFEPERLQKWTNMANFSETEGKKNGPDIHPTLAGYKTLEAVLAKFCP